MCGGDNYFSFPVKKIAKHSLKKISIPIGVAFIVNLCQLRKKSN